MQESVPKTHFFRNIEHKVSDVKERANEDAKFCPQFCRELFDFLFKISYIYTCKLMQRVKNLLHKIYYVKIYSKREVQLFNIIINPLITSYNFFIIKTSKKLYILYKITIFIFSQY